MSARLSIILLKSSDNLKEKDRYVEYLSQEETNMSINSINLLKFDYCNVDKLHADLKPSLLPNEPGTAYKCLILTSKQAVESIELAFSEAKATSDRFEWTELGGSLDDHAGFELNDKLIVYCVGEATLSRFKRFAESKLNNTVVENRLVIRQQANDPDNKAHKQNAKALAGLIIQDYKWLKRKQADLDLSKYALYPCSSIRKDDLSNELGKEGVPLTELIAYKTVVSESGLAELDKLVDVCLGEEMMGVCLVFFSPSGCDFVFGQGERVADKIRNNSSRFKMISIGPSTTFKLKQCLAEYDAVVYELGEPSPKALADQLKLF